MKITLRQLAVFDAVARLNSVSKAAQEVHLSQSATTLALQDLEGNLGAALFHRHQRRLTLNENGRRLQPQARTLLRLAHEIEGEAAVEEGGLLTIAASPAIGNYLMPRICAEFISRHPKARIQLAVAEDPQIIEQVEAMKIDLGLIEGVSFRQMLEVRGWRKDDLVIVVSPRHWAVGRKVTLSQLQSEAWFLQPIGAPTRHQFVQAYPSLLGSTSIRFESDSVEAIKAGIAAGNGIGCLSRVAVAAELAAGTLKELRPRSFRVEREFKIITRRDVYHGALLEAFLECLATVGRDSPAGAG